MQHKKVYKPVESIILYCVENVKKADGRPIRLQVCYLVAQTPVAMALR